MSFAMDENVLEKEKKKFTVVLGEESLDEERGEKRWSVNGLLKKEMGRRGRSSSTLIVFEFSFSLIHIINIH